ncbi:DUF4430 domain-containing protein [Hyunsoonleella pacifica]|uniref:DUF4430 domain-containing protein n=1 Tax=Hyunsoonleella pacifica TaxID=1080224 RepID=A0A4Q9FX24_9FLAO|nr:DUF4430 domain-containing protein [Hyunsoonleella pacifica]TBN19045.1 DUF4430 domain-containing protein [Hyunsoonleella pacifica]GGD06886.1 hypothetical protein GCM10011368_05930 [Hyunsoonleella pacifica]
MVTVQITGGPTYNVTWYQGMNGQNALQSAYNSSTQGSFTFSLQYYGTQFGYLVDMINETYDTFISKYEPYFFWQFLVNGTVSPTGIDATTINDGDVITFQFVTYNAETHKNTALEAKYNLKKLMISAN